MKGSYTELPSWSSALTELAFTSDALKAGRAKAIAVWNRTPTDFESSTAGEYEPRIPSSDYGANSLVEAASFAYAVIEECSRVDGRKVPYIAGGLQVEPAPSFLSSLPTALAVARDYASWALVAKNAAARSQSGL